MIGVQENYKNMHGQPTLQNCRVCDSMLHFWLLELMNACKTHQKIIEFLKNIIAKDDYTNQEWAHY